MISLEIVLRIHQNAIQEFGGSQGVRENSLLEAAIARPFQTFDSIELYPGPVEKAAAILESIATNHPFIDGNKRTAYILMRFILLRGGMDILTSEDEKYDLVVAVAKGDMKFDAIKLWLEGKAINL